MLVLAQGFAHGLLTRLLPWFQRSGVVPDSEEEAFRAVLARVQRLRDASLPWAFIGGATLAVAVAGAPATNAHDLVWSVQGHVRIAREARPSGSS